MIIEAAGKRRYEEVRSFYHLLIDEMRGSACYIGWEKDIYPSPKLLRDSAEKGELYIGLEGGVIAAAMVCNDEGNEGYQKFPWKTEADDGEILVIHALGVRPPFARRGLGRAMVEKAGELAREQGKKVIRLDVLKGNLPAERLYAGMGFACQGDMRMYYEDTGWTDFSLYEYRLGD